MTGCPKSNSTALSNSPTTAVDLEGRGIHRVPIQISGWSYTRATEMDPTCNIPEIVVDAIESRERMPLRRSLRRDRCPSAVFHPTQNTLAIPEVERCSQAS
jgi:hypothetical protein